MKLIILVGCLMVTVNAGTYGGPKTSLEDIEREYMSGDKTSSYTQTAKVNVAPVSSPTKFGFVPQRTAYSYAATKPKYQYTQSNYQVKKTTHKPPPSDFQQQYSQTRSPVSYQHQYSSAASQQPAYSGPNYSQQYSTSSQQQYINQQQAQEYPYVQPETNQKYILQYQQPEQKYEQYENVRYLTDNSIAQPESKQYYAQQPQYYYVQSPTTAVESVLDPKAFQYVMFVPSYAANSIPVDQKYQDQYTTSPQLQLPPITTSVAKYTAAVPVKSSSTKSYSRPQTDNQYDAPSAKDQYQIQQEIVVKRNPKSLLDSYVPSIVQLEYLRQQGKSSYSKNY